MNGFRNYSGSSIKNEYRSNCDSKLPVRTRPTHIIRQMISLQTLFIQGSRYLVQETLHHTVANISKFSARP